MSKTSILIVDDNKSICRSLSRFLSYDYVTYTAHNGLEALDVLCDNHNIKIILSDIMMPVMDGIDMIEKVRLNNKEVVIIVMTAMYSADNIYEAMEKGADSYLAKPLDISLLNMLLQDATKSRRLVNCSNYACLLI
jgi:CheY-like chemotaxis protein